MKITIDIPGPAQREREEHPLAYAHTNGADTSVPHDTLTEYIDELEKRLNEIYRLVDDVAGLALYIPHRYEDHGENCPRCMLNSNITKIKKLSNLTDLNVVIE